MSLDSKIVWSEGLFLSPQHFQQQERYLEGYVDRKCQPFGESSWGIIDFEIDKQLLKLGKISALSGSGVFPDGTPFSFPNVDDVPPVLELKPGVHDQTVYLCVPVRRPGAVEVMGDSAQGAARYVSREQQIRNNVEEGSENISVNVGKLRIKLMLASEDLSGYVRIGVLRVIESREDKDVLLDENHLATCLDCRAAPKLHGFLAELIGLLHHRAESIAGRLADANRGGTAEVADYMMLQLVNRIEPLARHLASIKGLHPLDLYTELVQMVGEISTFVAKTKRPPMFSAYLHDDLQATFTPVISTLRQCLSQVYEQTAVSLSLVEKKYGIRVSEITDRSMLASASYILAVRADIAEELVRGRVPAQFKIGPVERIRQLVNAAMPGITIKVLPVAPRQIPFRSGTCYFELEKQSGFWKELQNSGGFALHVGGDFPGLEIEFWAIRQN